jgi:hypothetical protein
MRTRQQIIDFFNKRQKEGLGLLEQQTQVDAVILEVLLDIRDLLEKLTDRNREVVVDFVPPDYGKENEL